MTHADSRLELWLVDLARSGPTLAALECATPRLADDDRERAAAIRDAIEREERIAAYIALRVVLERAAGAGIRRRPLVREEGRAPRLAGVGPRFSLSHTQGFALIGVAASLEIGVDLERTRPLKMAQRRRDEICAVGAGLGARPLPATEADAALLQAWVRLEAFTKARGRALAETLADLGLRGEGPAPQERLEAAARQLALQAGLIASDLDLPPPLQGALAAASGTRLPHRPRRLPADRARLERLLAMHWPGIAGSGCGP